MGTPEATASPGDLIKGSAGRRSVVETLPATADSFEKRDPNNTRSGVWRALPAELAAVGEARSLVRTALTGWELDEVADDLVLVASELVSNALRHALGLNNDGPGAGLPPSVNEGLELVTDTVWISLVRTAGHVICTVADPSHRPPVRRDTDPMSGCGQGLALVESLSTDWGWDELTEQSGKSVWAIVPLAQDAWTAVGAA